MWVQFNANPMQHTDDDCSVRAISKALGIDWETAYLMLTRMGFSMAKMPHGNDVIAGVLRANGFRKMFPPDDCPDCYSVETFAERNPQGTFVVFSPSHVATVEDGDLYDTWDSLGKTILYVFYKDEEPIFEEEE